MPYLYPYPKQLTFENVCHWIQHAVPDSMRFENDFMHTTCLVVQNNARVPKLWTTALKLINQKRYPVMRRKQFDARCLQQQKSAAVYAAAKSVPSTLRSSLYYYDTYSYTGSYTTYTPTYVTLE